LVTQLILLSPALKLFPHSQLRLNKQIIFIVQLIVGAFNTDLKLWLAGTSADAPLFAKLADISEPQVHHFGAKGFIGSNFHQIILVSIRFSLKIW